MKTVPTEHAENTEKEKKEGGKGDRREITPVSLDTVRKLSDELLNSLDGIPDPSETVRRLRGDLRVPFDVTRKPLERLQKLSDQVPTLVDDLRKL